MKKQRGFSRDVAGVDLLDRAAVRCRHRRRVGAGVRVVEHLGLGRRGRRESFGNERELLFFLHAERRHPQEEVER
jgi:hypothetical protein